MCFCVRVSLCLSHQPISMLIPDVWFFYDVLFLTFSPTACSYGSTNFKTHLVFWGLQIWIRIEICCCFKYKFKNKQNIYVQEVIRKLENINWCLCFNLWMSFSDGLALWSILNKQRLLVHRGLFVMSKPASDSLHEDTTIFMILGN